MFNIKVQPTRPSVNGPFDLKITVEGAKMNINGDEWDFSFMTPGSSLPVSAFESTTIISGVDCDADGTLTLELAIPVDYGDSLEPYAMGKVGDGLVCDVHTQPVMPVHEVQDAKD